MKWKEVCTVTLRFQEMTYSESLWVLVQYLFCTKISFEEIKFGAQPGISDFTWI